MPNHQTRRNRRGLPPTRLEVERRRLGLTQVQLAERAGVQQATVSRWERGQRPAAWGRAAQRLADTVGVDFEELFFGQDPAANHVWDEAANA